MEKLGSYLGIQATLNISKSLQWSHLLRVNGEPIEIDVRYEKLPIACYRCGIIGHTELSCLIPGNKGHDYLSQLYRLWFQFDTYGPEYRKQTGRQFGFPSSPGWYMRAPKDDAFSPAMVRIAAALSRASLTNLPLMLYKIWKVFKPRKPLH